MWLVRWLCVWLLLWFKRTFHTIFKTQIQPSTSWTRRAPGGGRMSLTLTNVTCRFLTPCDAAAAVRMSAARCRVGKLRLLIFGGLRGATQKLFQDCIFILLQINPCLSGLGLEFSSWQCRLLRLSSCSQELIQNVP